MKKLFSIFCTILLFIGLITPVQAQEEFDIVSEYAILINLDDDQKIYEKNSDVKMFPASMTKVMTVLTALDYITNLDEQITIDASMLDGLEEADASVAGFKIGEQVTMRDLIYGALLPSGADACRALAIYATGSESSFIDKMNEKANVLQLKQTHFMNSTGLHEDEHYTTVEDMSIIVKTALNNEVFYEAFTATEYTSSSTIQHPDGLDMVSSVRKQEKNFAFSPDTISGGKTGFTLEGGLCLASIGIHDNARYLLITGYAGNDASYPQHIADAHTIYDKMYETYDYIEVRVKQSIIDTIHIKYNLFNRELDVLLQEPLLALVPRNADMKDIKVTYNGALELEAPIEKGQHLGNIQVTYEDKILKEVTFYAPDDIGKNWLLYGLAMIIDFFVSIRYILCTVLFLFVGWVAYRRYKVIQRRKRRIRKRSQK